MANRIREEASRKRGEDFSDSSADWGFPGRPGWWAAGLYLVLTFCATYPLVLNPSQSVYSPGDHISTDIYSAMAINLWWPKHAIWELGSAVTKNGLLCAPYGQSLMLPSLIGIAMLPITLLAGPVLVSNLLTWAGYFLSAFFTYLLVFHITRQRLASIIAGVIFAFCPYMLLRGYTTYDTIQAQWIPLYILSLLKFDEERSWRHAGLIVVSLVGALFLSFPYYFVFMPILTGVYLLFRIVVHFGRAAPNSNLLPSFSELIHLRDLAKLLLAAAVVLTLFTIHYRFGIQPPTDLPRAEAAMPGARNIEQQWELRMATKDYFVPLPQSAVFGNWVKGYWDEVYAVERRNSINSAAFVGYVGLALAVYGLYRRRDWRMAFFAVIGFLAFLTTLGPYLNLGGIEIPTPAWLMFQFASFVRRINAYKVYVQLAVAVLAGVGMGLVLKRFQNRWRQGLTACGAIVLIGLEYTIVPPFKNTDVTFTPSAYKWLSQIPDDPVVLEYPMRKTWGAYYQGYYYYQMAHRKRLFNGQIGNSYIPLRYRPFWEDMEVPAAIGDENNQALLRFFGVKYVVKHYRVQSRTAILRSLPQPDFDALNGLKLAYGSSDFRREYREFSPGFIYRNLKLMVTDVRTLDHPHDYIWTDIFEVVAEPASVMLTWDSRSPYPSSSKASEYFEVNLTEEEKNFYPPTMMFFDGKEWLSILGSDNAQSLREQSGNLKVSLDLRPWRMMKNDGKMKALNLIDREVHFDIHFEAVSFDGPRRVEVWVGESGSTERLLGEFPVETRSGIIELRDIKLGQDQKMDFRFHASGEPSQLKDDKGGVREVTLGFHNFRVIPRS